MPPSTHPQPALAHALRELRRERKLSQEEVAAKAGMHLTWVSRVEKGRNPTWNTVKLLAAGLGVTLVEVAARAEKHEATLRAQPPGGAAGPGG